MGLDQEGKDQGREAPFGAVQDTRFGDCEDHAGGEVRVMNRPIPRKGALVLTSKQLDELEDVVRKVQRIQRDTSPALRESTTWYLWVESKPRGAKE